MRTGLDHGARNRAPKRYHPAPTSFQGRGLSDEMSLEAARSSESSGAVRDPKASAWGQSNRFASSQCIGIIHWNILTAAF